MKKRILFVLVIAAVLTFTGCGNSNSAEVPIEADSQMTENEPDELFSIEGKVLEVNETNILINESGYENGECYLTISDDTVISLDGEKADITMIAVGQTVRAMYTGGIEETYPGNIKDVKEIIAEHPSATEEKPGADEDMITFNGTIIDHVVEPTVPIVCVKPVENALPYETVYFELSDDEADWASRIGKDVTITCKVGFSEGLPFGTLISIAEAETDQAEILFTEDQIEEARQAAIAYYGGTVLTVNSIEYFAGDLPYGGGDGCCNFMVGVSKDGVMQEPGRTISLQLNNGIWEVVNEGY